MEHGISSSAACGIFPDQGSNPSPLHWEVNSLPAESPVCVCVCVCVYGSFVRSDSLQPHGLYSLSGSSVHGIFQARILELVTISYSRGSS